jgi:hypothetical protein
MRLAKLLAWFSGVACWAAAIVLIGLTSSAVRQSSGDVVYVVNAAFLLFGGVSIGKSVSMWVERRMTGARE